MLAIRAQNVSQIRRSKVTPARMNAQHEFALALAEPAPAYTAMVCVVTDVKLAALMV